MTHLWKGFRARRRLATLTRRLLACFVVGVGAGLGAVAFYWLLQACLALFLGHGCHYVPPEAGGEPTPFRAWLAAVPREPLRGWLVVMPAIGGILSGWLVFTFAPEAEGHGTDSAILAFHRLGGRIRARVPIVKAIASAITIGSGGSGGREGPIAQIGAGAASIYAARLRFPDRDRRLLMLAGLGAGVGAIFKAPLAGAIFAGEVLYREEELEYEALVPATISSIVAYSIFASVFGWQPLFVTPSFAFRRPVELVGYTILGIVCAAGGWLYIKVFYGLRNGFRRLALPDSLKPALGGLITGLIGLVLPACLATGYGQIQAALDGRLSAGFLLALALLKILATGFSIGSGGSGGVFGPAMVIGGALGGATGLWCYRLGLVQQPGAMVLVGMAGFFAGAANTPLSTIIMVSEMTGNYHLLVPAMWTCTISSVLLRRHSIYEKQVQNRRYSAAHAGELAVDILQTLRVSDWMRTDHMEIRSTTRLPELLRQLAQAAHTRHPVIGTDGRIEGILDVRDVLAVADRADRDQLTASDIIDPRYTSVAPEADLHEALGLLDHEPHGMLVVLDREQRFQGVLRRQDILHAYHEAGERTLQSIHRDEACAVHLPADTTVGEVMTTTLTPVPAQLPVSALAEVFQQTGHHGLPVVAADGELLGIVTLSDLDRAVDPTTQTAADICTRELVTCYPFETVVEAVAKFGQRDVGRIPVVDPADPSRLVGMLRRSDIIAAFAQAAQREQADADSAVVHALDVPQARFIEYRIGERCPVAGKAVRDLALPTECLLVSVRRGPSLLVPHGDTRLEVGDRVTVLCAIESRPAVEAAFASTRR